MIQFYLPPDFLANCQLENIVRLLLELEPETDPVWHYLNIQVNALDQNYLCFMSWPYLLVPLLISSIFISSQNSRIHGLFEKCTLDHEARMEVLQNKIREKILSDAKWRQLQQDSNKSVSSLGSA